jgi:nicotinate phosphoribosyltransferase
VRTILDDHGLNYVRILASGGLDEFEIAQLLADGCRIDSFAVGTKMGVSADAPYFDIAYKLVKYGGRPVMKLSTGKVTLVDQKQVWRHADGQNRPTRDVIALRDEALPGAAPLLQPVMRHGEILKPRPTLKEARQHFKKQFALLPEPYKDLTAPARYPVDLSPGLRDLQARVEQGIHQRQLGEG